MAPFWILPFQQAKQNSKRSQFSGISKESKHHPSRKSFFSWVYYNNFHIYSDCRIKRLNKTHKRMRGWTWPWGVNLPLRTLNVPGVWPQCAKNLKCELELWKSNKLEVVWCHTLTLLQNSYWRAVFQSNKLSTHTYRYVCRH